MSGNTLDGEAAGTAPVVPPELSAAYRRYAMFLLLLICIINYLDRQVVYILG